jgi:hypothetical protein
MEALGGRVLGCPGGWGLDATLPCPHTGVRCRCTPPPRRTGSTPSRASRGLRPARCPGGPRVTRTTMTTLGRGCPRPTGAPAAAAAAAAARATARPPPGAPGRRAAASCLAARRAQEHGRVAPGSVPVPRRSEQRPSHGGLSAAAGTPPPTGHPDGPRPPAPRSRGGGAAAAGHGQPRPRPRPPGRAPPSGVTRQCPCSSRAR